MTKSNGEQLIFVGVKDKNKRVPATYLKMKKPEIALDLSVINLVSKIFHNDKEKYTYNKITSERGVNSIDEKELEEVIDYYKSKDLEIDNQGNYFIHVSKKNKTMSGEMRLYLDVKDKYLIEVQKKLIDKLYNKKSFVESKINISNKNRDDSLLLYFSSDISKEEMKEVLDALNSVVKEYDENNIEPFESYDITIPFGERIFLKNKYCIGNIVYNPIDSSDGSIMISIGSSHSCAETPNSLISEIMYKMNEFTKEGGTKEEFYNKIRLQPNKYFTVDEKWKKKYGTKDFNLIEYTEAILEKIDETIPEEYRQQQFIF